MPVNVSTTTPRYRSERPVFLVFSALNASLRISVCLASRTASAAMACVNVVPGTPTLIYRPTRRVSDVESTTRVWSRSTVATPSSTVRAVWVVCVPVRTASTRTSTERSASPELSETAVRRPPTARPSSRTVFVTQCRPRVSVHRGSWLQRTAHGVFSGRSPIPVWSIWTVLPPSMTASASPGRVDALLECDPFPETPPA